MPAHTDVVAVGSQPLVFACQTGSFGVGSWGCGLWATASQAVGCRDYQVPMGVAVGAERRGCDVCSNGGHGHSDRRQWAVGGFGSRGAFGGEARVIGSREAVVLVPNAGEAGLEERNTTGAGLFVKRSRAVGGGSECKSGA